MDPLIAIESFIYLLSTALFYPVLLGLAGLAAWCAFASGSVLREMLERRRDPVRVVRSETVGLEAAVRSSGGADGLALEAALGEVRRRLTRRVDRVRFAVRVGPSLGLMGTLIPMATALGSLAGGDLPSLAGRMVTAFATTVVGLSIGIVAYVLTLARQRWADHDLDLLRLHAERLYDESVGDGRSPEGELAERNEMSDSHDASESPDPSKSEETVDAIAA
ncbi:MAG: MotA/TolQ/ExbB proton channel family protein [Gammaproteobacteria bacterium]|nr:MotA/TolQ/ExbB proton channel family protein [Gammaproteobacteria bacterium]